MAARLAVLAASIISLAAQSSEVWAEDALVPDRPGLLVSSQTVGLGRTHLELGANYERNQTGTQKIRVWTAPVSLRYGIGDEFELRLESDTFTHQRENDAGVAGKMDGVADVAVGFKWRVKDFEVGSSMPAMAWWFSADLPTGGQDLRGSGVRPALHLTMEWPLSEMTGIGFMPGLKYDRDDSGRYWSGVVGVAYSRQWSERLGSVLALEGQQLATTRHGGNIVDLNLSLTYLVDKDIQMDAAAGFGLNERSPDIAMTVGVSLRF